MKNSVNHKTSYEDVIELINSYEDSDNMLLDFLEESKPEFKVISSIEEDCDAIMDLFK